MITLLTVKCKAVMPLVVNSILMTQKKLKAERRLLKYIPATSDRAEGWP